MIPVRRRFRLQYDDEIKAINLYCLDELTKKWTERDEFTEVFDRIMKMEFTLKKVIRQPKPGDPIPPPGILYPSLIAHIFYTRLKEAFPDESITVDCYSP